MRGAMIFSILLMVAYAHAQPAAIDSSFGHNGMAVTPQATIINDFNFCTNGDIVSVGYGTTAGNKNYTVLAKYNKDGVPDVTFGSNGVATDTIGEESAGIALYILPDNRLLVAGHAEFPTSGGYALRGMYVARYLANGMRDSSFAFNGVYEWHTIPNQVTNIAPSNIDVLPNGKILAFGNKSVKSTGMVGVVTRLNSNGTLDNQFGNNGVVSFYDTNCQLMLYNFTLLSDSSYLCYGMDVLHAPLYRLGANKIDRDGQLVSSFAKNGQLVLDQFPPTNAAALEMLTKAVELPNKQILFSGYDTLSLFLRLNANGNIDSSFGTHGVLHYPNMHWRHPYNDMVLQADGKILLGGTDQYTTNYAYAVTRLDTNYSLDTSFNQTGSFRYNPSPTTDELRRMRPLSTTRLVFCGNMSAPGGHAGVVGRINLNTLLHVNTYSSKKESFSVYPNPANDKLVIKADNNTGNNGQLVIYDYTGKELIRQPIQPGYKTEINIAALGPGMYYAEVTTSTGRATQKFVKQ